MQEATTTEAPRRRTGPGRILVYLLAALGGFTLLMLLLVVVIASFAAMASPGVPSTAILEIDFERGVIEHVADDPIAAILSERQLTTRGVVEGLRRAAEDDRVVAVVARIGAGNMGMAQVEDIRDAVIDFRASGKPAIAYSETFGEVGPGQAGYYLATAFDSIYLQPSGDIGLTGLASESPFFAGTLDELDIEVQMDHRYEYKNAMNIFTEESMNEPHREALEAVLRSMYESIVAGISERRGLDAARVSEIIDNGPYFGREALELGLVDGLAYRDEVYAGLRDTHGDRAEFLFLQRYRDRAGTGARRGDRVALIHGVGAVQRGSPGFSPMTGNVMASDQVTRAFREAIDDDNVRAIIFRVDSPGGSYVASDAIWRETVRARDAGKPVIVTFGNVAASGGYFVAMSANRIIAQPSTITGSIGVLGGKFNLSGFWDRLGVTWDAAMVGENAGMWSSNQDYTEEEWERFTFWLDRVYDDFTQKVADGRGMTQEEVHEVARGRIWSGRDALAVGLVDELGGYPAALAAVREELGLEVDAPLQVRPYPQPRSPVEAIFDRGPDSSEPAHIALMRWAVETIQPIGVMARRAGLVEPAGVLSAPDAEMLMR